MKMMWFNQRWSQIHEDLWKTWVHGKSKRGGPTRIHVPDSPTLVPISVCDRVGESSPWKIWSRSSLVLKYISDGNETVFFHGTTFLLGWLLCACCFLFGDRTRNDSRVGRDLYRTRVLTTAWVCTIVALVTTHSTEFRSLIFFNYVLCIFWWSTCFC